MLKLKVGECYTISVKRDCTILKDMEGNIIKSYNDLVELYTDIHQNKYTYRDKSSWVY